MCAWSCCWCDNNNDAAPLEPSGTREARPVPVQTPSSSFLQRNWTYTTADKANLSFSPQREKQKEISRSSSSSEEEEEGLEAFASTPQKRAPSAQQQRPHAGRSLVERSLQRNASCVTTCNCALPYYPQKASTHIQDRISPNRLREVDASVAFPWNLYKTENTNRIKTDQKQSTRTRA